MDKTEHLTMSYSYKILFPKYSAYYEDIPCQLWKKSILWSCIITNVASFT